MKNTLSVIFDKSMIVMDRTFAKLAANTNSKEYESSSRFAEITRIL